MRGLRFIPADINISFIPKRIMFFIFSAVLITSSVGLFLTKGLNYGIDFQGGILMEVRTDKAADISVMRTTLGNLGLGEVALQVKQLMRRGGIDEWLEVTQERKKVGHVHVVSQFA